MILVFSFGFLGFFLFLGTAFPACYTAVEKFSGF
jgi:hypothetical protein